jgi:hypothetical protein
VKTFLLSLVELRRFLLAVYDRPGFCPGLRLLRPTQTCGLLRRRSFRAGLHGYLLPPLVETSHHRAPTDVSAAGVLDAKRIGIAKRQRQIHRAEHWDVGLSTFWDPDIGYFSGCLAQRDEAVRSSQGRPFSFLGTQRTWSDEMPHGALTGTQQSLLCIIAIGDTRMRPILSEPRASIDVLDDCQLRALLDVMYYHARMRSAAPHLQAPRMT